jgi:hypothetical protein
MGFALQWHTAHSGSEPIVAATDRPQPVDLQSDVLVVMCEIRRSSGDGHSEDTPAAGALARDIVQTYYDACPGADATQSDEVIAERMADAITLSAGRIAPPQTNAVACNILAVAVRGRTLLVARRGDGQVYLLRNAELQHLTESEMDATDPLELGKLELKGEDRVLVCTGALGDALKPIDLRRTLKAQPSSRRTAHALLHAAEQARELQGAPQRQIGLAVIDFVTGRFGAFSTKPEGPTAPPTRARVAALPLAIVASVGLLATIAAASTMAASAQRSASANANALPMLAQIATSAPQPAAQPLPVVQAGVPGAGPVVVEPDGALPKPGAMAMASATARPVLPRKSASGPTFLRNIRAKPTASVGPTPTPLALAANSAPAPIALTDAVGVDRATTTPAPTGQPAPVKRSPRRVLVIEPRTAAITPGQALALSAEVRDENGMVVTSDVVTWQPSELVVAADARSAIFNASTSGTFTVTASLGDLRGQATIVVLIPLEVAAAPVSTTVDSPTQAPLSTPVELTATTQPTVAPAPQTPTQTQTAQPPEPTPDPNSMPTPTSTFDPTAPPTLAPTPVLTQTTAEPIPTPEG